MSDGSPPQDHGQATLARGASIGRYVVLGLVGRGGMGEVYAAYDPELDRKVAVKLLRIKPGAGVSLTEGRQRTLREAQAIARLSHPNVVVVFDVGPFEEKVFIAMEFVEGHTAGFWANSQTRTWQETLKVYLAAGRGLAAAHDKGMVHRDFKPDNVMVSRDGQVRVMDFGLARQAEKPAAAAGAGANGANGAKAVATKEGVTTTQRLPAPLAEPGAPVAALDGSTLVLTPSGGNPRGDDLEQSNSAMFDARLTKTGAMMGTPAYMAPEQFRGLATDARTDQFAFCIALYEALYGERPFAGNTLMQLTTNVVNGKLRDGASASSNTNTNVPLWIRKILLRGLRVNPDERFPSMADLLDALGKNPAVARRRWAIATAALLLAGGFGFTVQKGLAVSAPVCADGPEKLAGIWEVVDAGQGGGAAETPRQAKLHDAFLKTGKSYAKDVWVTTSRALTNYARAWADMYKDSCEATAVHKAQSEEVLDLRMSCLQERLGGLRALTDVFADANGEVVENAVGASNALASLDRCADVPLLRAVVRPPEDAKTRQNVEALRKRIAELKARFDAGDWRTGVRDARTLVDETRRVGYQPLVADMLALLGTISCKSDNAVDAERAYVESFRIADAARHDEVRAESAVMLVYIVGFQQSRFQDAHAWAETADAVLRRLGGHELLRSWLLNDEGAVYFAEGKSEVAVRSMEQSIEIKGRALGRQHPDVGVSEGNVAIFLAELGRHSEALTHIERSLALLEKGLGAAHPDLALQLANHGEILNALGKPREALKSFERARDIWERELGTENRSLAYALTGIGVSYLAEGNPKQALPMLERAFKIRSDKETNPSKRAETEFALARTLWELNIDRDRAHSLAVNAREGFQRALAKVKVTEIESWLRARHAVMTASRP